MNSASAEMSDGELARLALAGREDGYRRLLERHRDAVFRLVRSLVGDSDAALDITQEAFVSGFAALKRYDPERPFRAWMSRIANRCVINFSIAALDSAITFSRRGASCSR